jgi:putative flavoprotein involved in K+ transport
MPTEHVETLIVGGGQAGLVMSDMLSRRGKPHLVIERGRIAERWRTERWDGLRFQFPNWSVRLADYQLPHSEPDGFATSSQIVDFLDAYATQTKVPIHCGVAVNALRQNERGNGYIAETSVGSIRAMNVVIATGPYQRPSRPDLASDDCGLFQVHTSEYKEPDQLPPGAVMIVGSGASGTQIAEELARAGRRVYLAVGQHKRMPRRYRGRDLIWWLGAMGLDQTPVEERGADAAMPLITGAYGGHTIDFREFVSQGITLLGRLQSVCYGVLYFADDFKESLEYGDAAYSAFLDRADSFVDQQGINIPVEPEARVNSPAPQSAFEPARQLDMRQIGLSSVIWATGYTFDFGWINLPVLNGRGEPKHHHGIAPVPNIYFLGLPWLSKMNSSFLSGVAGDAARLADCIQRSDQ